MDFLSEIDIIDGRRMSANAIIKVLEAKNNEKIAIFAAKFQQRYEIQRI